MLFRSHLTQVKDMRTKSADVSLATYMRLPVEQYFVLDTATIVSLGGNRFLLRVPRLSFFHVWVEPEIEVSVCPR